MVEATKIEWADHTFNGWVGCQKVSEACRNCYAETWAKRSGQPNLWRGERRVTSDANWRKPLKWNERAEETGVRERVFCSSLADIFEDREDLIEPRRRLFELIAATPHLDWLLLTKRPENFADMLPWVHREYHDELPGSPSELFWEKPPHNVWLGVTAETQADADRRIPLLLDTPAVCRFVSVEPMLEAINLRAIWDRFGVAGWDEDIRVDALRGVERVGPRDEGRRTTRIDQVICGGETGGGARTMNPEWARYLRDQCLAAGAAFFMKQMTRKAPIPDDLFIRQVPEVCGG